MFLPELTLLLNLIWEDQTDAALLYASLMTAEGLDIIGYQTFVCVGGTERTPAVISTPIIHMEMT